MGMARKHRRKKREQPVSGPRRKRFPKHLVKLREDILIRPVYKFNTDEISSKYPALIKKESSRYGFRKDREINQEYIDPPEMDVQTESGEGPSLSDGISDRPPASSADRIRQKMMEDFNDKEDSEMIHKVMTVLKNWEQERKNIQQWIKK